MDIKSLFHPAIRLLYLIELFIYSIAIKKTTKKTIKVTRGKKYEKLNFRNILHFTKIVSPAGSHRFY